MTKRSLTLKSQEKKLILEITPTENEIREFWSTILSNKIEHKEGTWLNEIKYDGQDMKYEQITTEGV